MQLWDDAIRCGATQSVCIIGATNRPQDIDPAILRRFEKIVRVPLPTAETRRRIFAFHLLGHDASNVKMADNSYDTTAQTDDVSKPSSITMPAMTASFSSDVDYLCVFGADARVIGLDKPRKLGDNSSGGWFVVDVNYYCCCY
jgi:SpoVK/Ycf46/Vps4 family AAA+-type ATPase